MTNREAAAYLVIAMKRAGFTLEEIQKAERYMWSEFDWTSEEEAVEQADNILRGK